jgi:tetratricopeptide (TPR) repeat protein
LDVARMIGSSFMVATASLSLLCTSAAAQNWKKYMELGGQEETAQNLGESEKQFKAAIKEAHKSGGNELQLAESLDGLAALYEDRKKYSRSEALYRQSLNIREMILGSWNLTVAQSLDNLARLLDSQGKHKRAEPLYRRAHQIREHALAAHPDIYIDGVPKPVLLPK